MQIPASSDLSGIVRHYLFLDLSPTNGKRIRFFPDGSSGIVFSHDGNLMLDSKPLPKAFVYGPISEFKDIECLEPAKLTVAVLHPDGLTRLFQVHASKLSNEAIPLVDLIGTRVDQLQKILDKSLWSSEKILYIESILRNVASRHPLNSDSLVSAALNSILLNNGAGSIQDIAILTGLHTRQLERRFNTSVGISPKKFSKIVRIHHSMKLFKQEQGKAHLTHCAFNSGYYDQAHFIREFKAVTGLTPSKYLKTEAPPAANFIYMGA